MTRPLHFLFGVWQAESGSSSEEKSAVRTLRQLSALGSVLLLLYGAAYSLVSPVEVDPWWGRVSLSALLLGAAGLSFVSVHVRRYFVAIIRSILYLMMWWFVVIDAVNHFPGDYTIGTVLLYAVAAAIMGIGSRSLAPVLWFSGYGLFITGLALALVPAHETSPTILLGSMATLAVIEGFAIQMHLTVREELREREERLRTITENVSEGIFRMTPNDGLVYANQAFANMFGFDTTDEVLQTSPAALYADPEVYENILRRAEREERVKATEVDLRRRDGSTFTGLVSTTVVRDSEGNITSFDGAISDITERIEAERALRESEERFRGVFENAAVGIAVVDSTGRVLEANPALQRMIGYRAEELQGRHFAQLTHPDDVESDEQHFSELMDGVRDRYQIEKRYIRADGSEFWGRLTVSRHLGPGDGVVIGMIEDIDDQKQYEQDLRDAKEEAERMNRLKTAFLANMSHEIRTPLTSILGFAEAIGDQVAGMSDDATADELSSLSQFAHMIKRGGHRLKETLDSVLNLSKLEAGEMEVSAEPVDLRGELQDIAATFETRADDEDIDLRVDTPKRALVAYVDQTAIRIALRNLLSNAIKYTAEGGTVWARARADENEAVLEVEDTGIGMPPEQVSDLFKAFKQESEGVGREYEGSGLGLTITKRLIDEMNGSIQVETEKNEGTCVTLQFPQLAREGDSAPATASEEN